MVTPQYEQHSLGAFVAADNLRRHGLWVHMAIGLNYQEIADLLAQAASQWSESRLRHGIG